MKFNDSQIQKLKQEAWSEHCKEQHNQLKNKFKKEFKEKEQKGTIWQRLFPYKVQIVRRSK